jgi:hypothetical protein
MMNMHEMLMIMIWDVNACLTPRGVTGWDRTHVLSVRIWTVGIIPLVTTMRCCLIGVTWH